MASAAVNAAQAAADHSLPPRRDGTLGTAPLSPTSAGSSPRWNATQPDTQPHCEDFGIPSHLMAQLEATCNTQTVDIMPREEFLSLVADVLACTPTEEIQTEVSRRVKIQTRGRRIQLRAEERRFSRNPLVREHARAPALCLPIYKDTLYGQWDFLIAAKDIIVRELQARQRSRRTQPKTKAPRRSKRIQAQKAAVKK